jgi:hypothetical protein
MATKPKTLMNTTDNPKVYKYAKKQVDLSCPHCKPHKQENAGRKSKHGHNKQNKKIK